MRVEPASALPAADVQALIRTIEALEGQRTTLGDSVVDLAIAPLRARLAGNADDRSGGTAVDRSGERKIVTVLFVDIAGFTENCYGRASPTFTI